MEWKQKNKTKGSDEIIAHWKWRKEIVGSLVNLKRQGRKHWNDVSLLQITGWIRRSEKKIKWGKR